LFEIREKSRTMRTQGTGNSARQRMTRVMATGALIFMYAFGMVATTGAFVAAGVSPAHAQRGRGRGWGGRGRGGGVGVGTAVGIGVGAAIIGGAIAASAAEQQRQQAISYCMQRYRSYDPDSMTYLGRDGMRYSCP
jgi:BA14K-like protein